MCINRYPNHLQFGLPASARFFFTEDDGGGSGGGGNDNGSEGGDVGDADSDTGLVDFDPDAANQERVEGEEKPDFSSLGRKGAAPAAKPAAPAAKEPAAAPAKPAAAPSTPPKGQKPPAGQSAKPATPAKPAAKPAATPAKPAAAPATPPAKKEGAAAEPPKKDGELPEIPANDDDINALQPKPGAPTQVIKSFNDIKARMLTERNTARQAVAEAKRAKEEADTLRQSAGQLPPETAQELENLRKLSLLVNVEKDPTFQKEYVGKITAADTQVYDFLTANGLPPKVLEEIKKAATAENGIEDWPKFAELAAAFKNPIDQQKFLNMVAARRDAVGAKNARVAELTTSKAKFHEELGKQDEYAKQQFATKLSEASIPFAAGADWIQEQEVPDDATPEQKAEIEAANAAAKARAEAFGENARAIYHRDPAKAAEVSFKAVEADYLRERLEVEIPALNETITKQAARIKELEGRISKTRQAGRLAHVESPAPDKLGASKAESDGKIGGDGHSAVATFFGNRNK